MLRIVARYADASNVHLVTPEEARHKWAVLDRHCEDVGRDPRELRRTVLNRLYVTEDPAVRRAATRELAELRGIDERHADACLLIGSLDEIAEQVARFADAGATDIYVGRPHRPDLEELLAFSEGIVARWPG